MSSPLYKSPRHTRDRSFAVRHPRYKIPLSDLEEFLYGILDEIDSQMEYVSIDGEDIEKKRSLHKISKLIDEFRSERTTYTDGFNVWKYEP